MNLRDLFAIYVAPVSFKLKTASISRKVFNCESLDQFYNELEKSGSNRFSFYRDLAPVKSRASAGLLNHLDIDPCGLTVLDIGPGYGEFLDMCAEMGATRLRYIELDPVFFEFNRLKGYSGESANHLFSMKNWPESTIDLIWVSGSVSANVLTSSKKARRILSQWLASLDRALTPSGHSIIKPWFRSKGGERSFSDALDNPFAETMREFGYTALPFFEGHNHEPEYPVTFFKKV